MSTRTRTRPVPAATKPTNVGRPRAGRQWSVKIAQAWADPVFTKTSMALHRGMVVAQWSGARGTVHCSKETWDEVSVNQRWADEIADMQEEARRTMPRAVMRDVSVSAAGHAVVQPGHPVPTADVGITALGKEIARLVQDMAQYENPSLAVQADFARRYGRYRDTMTRLRREFTEAEGAFETAQAMLVCFMSDD